MSVLRTPDDGRMVATRQRARHLGMNSRPWPLLQRAARVVLRVVWIAFAACWSMAAHAQAPATPRVQVAEPYLEIHSGPGRGYPVFHVVKRGGWITVLKRRTDWFQIVTEDGLQGWATRQEMELTLTEAGSETEFRDVLVDHYLRDRLVFGVAGGDMEGQTVMTVRASYAFTENLQSELTVSQVSGTYTSTQVFSVHLVALPARKGLFVPLLSLGVGQFRDSPRKTLVDPESSNSLTGVVGLGLNTYLTDRFMLRLDYRNFVILVDDDEAREYDEITGGFSFVF